MNYLFTEPVIQFVGQQHIIREEVRYSAYDPYPPIKADHFAEKLDMLLNMYPWEINLAQLNLLDSHDTPRLISIVGEDRASVRLATILLMTFPGAPSVYYGDEIGLAGHRDPDCRRTIPWDKPETWDRETLAYMRQLIALRKEHIALRRGKYMRLYAEDLAYAFARQYEDDTILTAINAGDSPAKITIPVSGLLADGIALKAVYGSGDVTVEGGNVQVTIPARDGIVLAK
jgi:cyclomaltodextrinase